tara:strand:+ start:314 stop:742 length:429 start_codon:yes stop_codon:yes gene_type:complete
MRYFLNTISYAIAASIQTNSTVKVYVDNDRHEQTDAQKALRAASNIGLIRDGGKYHGRTTGGDDFAIELVVSGWVHCIAPAAKVLLDEGVPVKISIIAGEWDDLPDYRSILRREFGLDDVRCDNWEAAELENEQVADIRAEF